MQQSEKSHLSKISSCVHINSEQVCDFYYVPLELEVAKLPLYKVEV